MDSTFYQVTEYLQPDDWVETIFGPRRAMWWLASEVARWASKGDVAIIQSTNGLVALFGQGIELTT